MKKKTLNTVKGQAGFSMIELFAVLLVIGIVTAISIFYLSGHQKAYRPDDESLLVVDVLQEARQRSLTQRETMRVEINRDARSVSLYDENSPTTVDDDRLLKTVRLYDPSEVTVGSLPGNVTVFPPEPLPAPISNFSPSVYPASIAQSVCTLRFRSNGTVENAGNDAIGTGAVVTGATVPFWSPRRNAANANLSNNTDIARAITVIGSTGTVRLWEYDWSIGWKDSRRYGTYGGAIGGNGNANFH